MLSGVPSALSAHETRILRQYVRGQRVVEAGALLGYSTIQLADVAAHVVSIDKHEGYTAPTFRQFRSNLERAGVSSKVTPVVGEALDALPHYAGDLAFIDLTCAYTLTKSATLAARTPLVAIHDYGRTTCEGVGKLVAELITLQWRVVERADTLVILARPHA